MKHPLKGKALTELDFRGNHLLLVHIFKPGLKLENHEGSCQVIDTAIGLCTAEAARLADGVEIGNCQHIVTHMAEKVGNFHWGNYAKNHRDCQTNDAFWIMIKCSKTGWCECQERQTL